MCMDNVKRKWQLFGKQKFAYKVLRRTNNSNLQTPIAGKSVRNNCTDWQGPYQRVPRTLRANLYTHDKIHERKISVFRKLEAAKEWNKNSADEIWFVEIKYDKFLVGKQFNRQDSALVDEFRLVARMPTGK